MFIIIDIKIITIPITIAPSRITIVLSMISNGLCLRPIDLYKGSRACSNPNTEPYTKPKNALESPTRCKIAPSRFPFFLYTKYPTKEITKPCPKSPNIIPNNKV